MKHCVRCGKQIESKHNRLRCDTCRKLVDEQFSGGIKRPFEFYFKYIRESKKEKESD